MKIKIDEDLPKDIISLLHEAGYDASGVFEQGMGGWKDPALWKFIQSDNRFLVTADKGFGDIRVYPPGSHNGILVLRPREDGIGPLISLMQRLLSAYSLEELTGSVTVVNPRSIRIRKV
jgi:predicted nuclease of predicted toxin-antitoxin system